MGVGVLKKKEKDIIYYDNFENSKNLKFRNFIDINENVKYIDSEEALKFIETSSQ